MALSDGCRLVRALRKDAPVRIEDVERPEDRLGDRLFQAQAEHFSPRLPS